MAHAVGSTVRARDVSRRFGATLALDGVSLDVGAGEIHALLGRNGAGKTTLLRILTGLVDPSEGEVRVADVDGASAPRKLRDRIAVVPSGDRSFYLRISGLENLVFFGRLRGLRKSEAAARARRAFEQVGLTGVSRLAVGKYSHGMQKRLSVARALMADAPVLLVDEATHDLDPEGARQVRGIVRGLADGGAAVVWATQRVEEIAGFADGLTLLDEGRVRFAGTVAELLRRRPPQRFVVGVGNGAGDAGSLAALQSRITPVGSLVRGPAADELVVSLEAGRVLGDALAVLIDAGVSVVSCRRESPEVEDALLGLLEDES
jgi:ABC-type multidrug transport system ATPase subunit